MFICIQKPVLLNFKTAENVINPLLINDSYEYRLLIKQINSFFQQHYSSWTLSKHSSMFASNLWICDVSKKGYITFLLYSIYELHLSRVKWRILYSSFCIFFILYRIIFICISSPEIFLKLTEVNNFSLFFLFVRSPHSRGIHLCLFGRWFSFLAGLVVVLRKPEEVFLSNVWFGLAV